MATRDVRISVKGLTLVTECKRGREGVRGGLVCIVPILWLHTEGYWVQTLKSELQADRRGGKQHKKNKCRKPQHKGLNCNTWSRLLFLCTVWNAYFASRVYACGVGGRCNLISAPDSNYFNKLSSPHSVDRQVTIRDTTLDTIIFLMCRGIWILLILELWSI